MASADLRKDHLTPNDFIAYGSDSLEEACCLTESAFGALAENARAEGALAESGSQSFKRGGRSRLPEQRTLGTPQWYVKKIEEKTASRKQMADLQSLLQGRDSEYEPS